MPNGSLPPGARLEASAAAAAAEVEGDDGPAVADGLLSVKCEGCAGGFQLGFNVAQLLVARTVTLAPPAWRCRGCRGARTAKPFVFERPAAGIPPCPRPCAPGAPGRVAPDPPAAQAPGVLDALWQVDCDGNPDP